MVFVNQNTPMLKDKRYYLDQAREKRRETMRAVAGLEGLREFLDDNGELTKIGNILIERLGDRVEMKMMGQTVRATHVFAGRYNYFWLTVRQGEERMVVFSWPRPLFNDGVRGYATSETFIDRVRMVATIVDDEDLDYS